MNARVLPVDKLDVLAGKVRKLLVETGYLVEHDGIRSRLRAAGMKESSLRRFRLNSTPFFVSFVSFVVCTPYIFFSKVREVIWQKGNPQ